MLDRSTHPFVGQLGPGETAELRFVATEDCGWVELETSAGRIEDADTGHTIRLVLRGTYAIDLGDPVAVLLDLSGGDPGRSVVDWLARQIGVAAGRAVRALVESENVPLGRLDEPEIVGRLAERIARTLCSEHPRYVEGLRFSQLEIVPHPEDEPAWRRARGERTEAPPPPDARSIRVGRPVEVMWDGRIHGATVTGFDGARYEVMWDGGPATAFVPPTHVREKIDPAWRPRPGDRVEVRREDGHDDLAVVAADLGGGAYQVYWESPTGTSARTDRASIRPAAEEGIRQPPGPWEKPESARTWRTGAKVMVRAGHGQERPATVTGERALGYVVSYDDIRRREWVERERILGPRETSGGAAAGLFALDLAASLFLSKDAAHSVGTELNFERPPSDRKGPFREFDHVWAQADDRRWYRARIKRKVGSTTFLVAWEDPGFADSYLDERYLRAR